MSARGIDIPNVNYVINYDLPEQTENYVHRVGRTGRGTHSGFAVSFCSEREKPLLTEIEAFLGKPITIISLDKTDYSDTIDFSDDHKPDWKALEAEMEAFEKSQRRKRKKK